MKEQRLSGDLASLPFNPTQSSINEYVFAKEPVSNEIKKFLISYEWLQSVGVSAKWCFTMRLQGYLAGVQIFNEPAAYSKILKERSLKMECLVQRGCTVSWAHHHLGSKMLMASIKWMVKNTDKRIFVGYADSQAGEIGTLYSACNFKYLGNKFGVKYKYQHPSYKSNKPFCAHSLKRTSVFKTWCKQNNIKIESNYIKSNGFKDLKTIPLEIKKAWYNWANIIISESKKIPIESKGKYVLIRGKNKKEQRFLEKQITVKTYPYPKRTD